MIPYKPNEDEKIEALGSVFYEIQQLYYSSQFHSDTQPIENAFTEVSSQNSPTAR